MISLILSASALPSSKMLGLGWGEGVGKKSPLPYNMIYLRRYMRLSQSLPWLWNFWKVQNLCNKFPICWWYSGQNSDRTLDIIRLKQAFVLQKIWKSSKMFTILSKEFKKSFSFFREKKLYLIKTQIPLK